MPSEGELSLCTARATDCLPSQRNADLLAQEMGNILEKIPLQLADVSNGVMKQLFYYAACNIKKSMTVRDVTIQTKRF
jgi:hypothetical protein